MASKNKAANIKPSPHGDIRTTGQERPAVPAQLERVCFWLLLACIPASMLAIAPRAIRPLFATYLKYFVCQTLATLAALGGALIWWARKKKRAPGDLPGDWWAFPVALAAYAAWAAASALWSAWPYGTRGEVIWELWLYGLCLAFFVFFASPQRWLAFARVFVLSALIAAVWQGTRLLARFFALPEPKSLTGVYYMSSFVFGNINYSCSLLTCAALITLGYAVNSVREASLKTGKPTVPTPLIGHLAAVSVFVFLLIAANSLAGFLAAGIALVSYAVCMLPLRRRAAVAAGLVAVAAIPLLVAASVPPLRERILDRILGQESTAQARVMWWVAAYDMVREKPVAGWGAGTYAAVYPRFEPEAAEKSFYTRPGVQPDHPHSEFLRVASDLGLIGLALYVSALSLVMISSYRMIRQQEFPFRSVGFALWAAMLGYIVQSALGNELTSWDFALGYWMLLGLLASAVRWDYAARAAPAGGRLSAARWIGWAVSAAAITWVWWGCAWGAYRSMLHLDVAHDRCNELRAYCDLTGPQRAGFGEQWVERTAREVSERLALAEPRAPLPYRVLMYHYNAGTALARLGLCSHALPHLEWVQRAAPGAAGVEYLLAECYISGGQTEKARPYLLSFIRRRPAATDAHLLLAQVDPQAAEHVLGQAPASVIRGLEAIYRKQGRPDVADSLRLRFPDVFPRHDTQK